MPDIINQLRGKVGAERRWNPDPAGVETAQKQLDAAVAEKHIRRWINAGHLTDAQRRELAIELLGGGDGP